MGEALGRRNDPVSARALIVVYPLRDANRQVRHHLGAGCRRGVRGTIIVTGATGQLDRLIVEKLVRRVPPNQISVSVRDPKKATDLEALDVRVRKGNFNNADSRLSAFEGATQVLIVSFNARASGRDSFVYHRTAINAAKAAGVRQTVYTSHMAASATSAFPPAQDHTATEGMLRQSGSAWIRHGFYAASGLMINSEGLKSGAIEAPADGKVLWTTRRSGRG